jgi:hypothetical protein
VTTNPTKATTKAPTAKTAPAKAPVRAPTLTSKQLLAHAYGVLEDPPSALAGRWPRAVALLARQALEASLADLWAKRETRVGWATERAQLLCLPEVLGNARVAADATLAWNALSEACHAHPYDLPPTAGELAQWLEAVDALRRAVDAVPAKGTGRNA